MPFVPKKLYYKIREVSEIVGVESHVLRFWETEFPSLHPPKEQIRRVNLQSLILNLQSFPTPSFPPCTTDSYKIIKQEAAAALLLFAKLTTLMDSNRRCIESELIAQTIYQISFSGKM